MAKAKRSRVEAQAATSRLAFLDAMSGDRSLDTQQEMLRECITANQSTDFGREHDFKGVRSMGDYKKAAPIRHYEELEPWISRIVDGEDRVLTESYPVRFWKTTGTTSKAKKIPVTSKMAMRNMESFLTLYGMQLHYHREVGGRNDTTLVTHLSPKRIKEFLGPKRIPYCSTTEVPVEPRSRSRDRMAPWARGLQDVVEDDSIRLYYLLCYAALHDLRSIVCLHPSRFRTIAACLENEWQSLIEDIRDGTVLGHPERNPAMKRAEELERVQKRNGVIRPRDIWPNLTFVASWSGGYIDRYRKLMSESFCDGFLPMPSISSEAFATMTIDQDPISQPLNIRGGLFEFIPADQKVKPDSETLEFHELQEGTSYEVILTTFGGLYRYAMCDIFTVRGFEGRVPRLEYSGRRSVSDLVGEKLAEDQVSTVVAQTLEQSDIDDSDFAMCGVQSVDAESKPIYVLALEARRDLEESRYEELAAILDREFRKVNSRYELKRNFQDIDHLRVQPLSHGTFVRYRQLLVDRGMPAGQLKDKVLHKDGHIVLSELLELSDALEGAN